MFLIASFRSLLLFLLSFSLSHSLWLLLLATINFACSSFTRCFAALQSLWFSCVPLFSFIILSSCVADSAVCGSQAFAFPSCDSFRISPDFRALLQELVVCHTLEYVCTLSGWPTWDYPPYYGGAFASYSVSHPLACMAHCWGTSRAAPLGGS